MPLAFSLCRKAQECESLYFEPLPPTKESRCLWFWFALVAFLLRLVVCLTNWRRQHPMCAGNPHGIHTSDIAFLWRIEVWISHVKTKKVFLKNGVYKVVAEASNQWGLGSVIIKPALSSCSRVVSSCSVWLWKLQPLHSNGVYHQEAPKKCIIPNRARRHFLYLHSATLNWTSIWR